MVLLPCSKCCGKCTCKGCLQLYASGSTADQNDPCFAFNYEARKRPFVGRYVEGLDLEGEQYECAYAFSISYDEISGADVLVGTAYLVLPKDVKPPNPNGPSQPPNGKALLFVRTSLGWTADYEIDEVKECPRYVAPGDSGATVDPNADEGYSITFTKADMVASTGNPDECGELTFTVTECHDPPPDKPVCCCVNGSILTAQSADECVKLLEGTVLGDECNYQEGTVYLYAEWCGIDIDNAAAGLAGNDMDGFGSQMQWDDVICRKEYVINPANGPELFEIRGVRGFLLVYPELKGWKCDSGGAYYAASGILQVLTDGIAVRVADGFDPGLGGNWLETYKWTFDSRSGVTLEIDPTNTSTTSLWCPFDGHLKCTGEVPVMRASVSFPPTP